MPSANVFTFYIFRGRGMEALFSLISIFSWALGGISIMIFLIADADGTLTWADKLLMSLLIAAWLAFIRTLKRLIFRRLDITLHGDYINIVYLPFLFLSEKAAQIYFSDIIDCKQVKANSRGAANYLKLTMKDNERLRIADDIKWLQKIEDYSANFSIQEIAEAHQLYRQKEYYKIHPQP